MQVQHQEATVAEIQYNDFEEKLGGGFGYFLFFLLGGGEGGVRGAGGGRGVIFCGKSQGGGVLPGGWGRGSEGPEGVCGEGGGGGLNIFFRGRNSHQGMVVWDLDGRNRAIQIENR